jgi:hypothetical protein
MYTTRASGTKLLLTILSPFHNHKIQGGHCQQFCSHISITFTWMHEPIITLALTSDREVRCNDLGGVGQSCKCQWACREKLHKTHIDQSSRLNFKQNCTISFLWRIEKKYRCWNCIKHTFGGKKATYKELGHEERISISSKRQTVDSRNCRLPRFHKKNYKCN